MCEQLKELSSRVQIHQVYETKSVKVWTIVFMMSLLQITSKCVS